MEKTKGTKKRESGKPTIKPFRFTIRPFLEERSKWIKVANETINTGKEKIEDFEYLFFYFGGDDLRAYPIAKGSEGSEDLIPYKGLKKIDPSIESIMTEDIPQICGSGLKNSWDIFYENWSLSDFIFYLSGESYFIVSDHEIEKTLKLRTRKEEKIPRVDNFLTKDEVAILKEIRNDPMLLHNTKIMNKFKDILVPILTTARWAIDRKEREWTKDLLSKHLIPKHSGGKKPLVTGVNYGLAVELMKRFAVFLSEKCKNWQNEMVSKTGDRKVYSDLNLLKEWAWEQKERRMSDVDISVMDIDDLKILIESPREKFVPRFIKAHLKVTQKTLSQFFKSS